MTADTTYPSVNGFEFVNLFQNLEHRSSGNNLKAITVAAPNKQTLSQNTCFKVDYAALKSNDNKFIIGFDFSESVFIHAVLHSQDELNVNTVMSAGPEYLKNFFQSYEIYIGDSENYNENKRCPGGPFLNPNDSESYVHN